MSATPLYLLTTKNDASSNPVHILTNGKASIGSNSSQIVDASSGIISTCSLNVGNSTTTTSFNTYGTYYSNNSSAIKIPSDTSANRPPGETGYLRFNTTINLLEFWSPSTLSWTPLGIPPTLISINPSVAATAIDISLNGVNFSSGATVGFIDASLNQFNSSIVTYVSSTRLIARADLSYNPVPYSVIVINPGGLSSTLSNVLSTGSAPIFTTSSGSIGSIWTGALVDASSAFTYYLAPVTATDPDTGGTIFYSITSGSLPPGLTINSVTGDISGNFTGALSAPSASPSSTTYTFTVKATDNTGANTSRNFSITVYQPYLVTYTYTGSATTFAIPFNATISQSKLSTITARLWGSGGGNYYSSGYPADFNCGAPGGFTKTTFNVLSAESNLTVVVGGGGAGNATYGYAGGGGGANGGSGGGGGSYIFTGSIATPFQNVTYVGSGGSYVNSEPTSSVTGLAGASGVIAVAGGGGGAGWYASFNGDINQNGGPGGGITAGQSTTNNSGRSVASGGSQTAGGVAISQGGSPTTPNYMTSAGYLKGSGHTDNFSSGGSGAGGGGWYGGGGYQGASGNNAGGGGGSGFAGFTNGSTSTVLTANTVNWSGSSTNSYTDSTTRTNGTRIYTNTQIYRKDNLNGAITSQQTPPGNTDTYYSSGVGTSGPRGVEVTGGNGLIVFIY